MEVKLQALKVPDLKKLLQDANLPVSGTKAELIKRILENPGAAASINGGEEEEEDLLGECDTEPATKAAAVAKPAEAAVRAETSKTAAKPAESGTPVTTKPASSAVNPAAPSDMTESAEDRKAALIAELEKRKARAARWGMPTDDVEAKLARAIKFGVEASQDSTLTALEGGLSEKKRREAKAKTIDGGPKPTPKENKATAAPPKPVETEEEKAARLARQEADEAKKKRRAERFGLPTAGPANGGSAAKTSGTPAVSADPAEEERKRKRQEKFGSQPSAEPADKKVKA